MGNDGVFVDLTVILCAISATTILIYLLQKYDQKSSGSFFSDSKGFGVVFPESKGFGEEFPESLEVLTSHPEFISSINPKYFDSCFIILIRFL